MSMPRYHASIRLGVRWPLHFGLEPLVSASEHWGWCRTYDFELGFLVIGFTAFGNPEWLWKEAK